MMVKMMMMSRGVNSWFCHNECVEEPKAERDTFIIFDVNNFDDKDFDDNDDDADNISDHNMTSKHLR